MAQKILLIVEDEALQRDVLRTKFEEEGYEVVTAVDGVEGLELAKKHQPDLILLDIVLPRITGLEMLEILRKDPWGKKAKVLILSNLTTFQDHEDMLGSEVHNLIKAESSLEEIVEAVKKSI